MPFDRDTITVIKVSGGQRQIRTSECEAITPRIGLWPAPPLVQWSLKDNIRKGLGFYPNLGEVYRHTKGAFWFVEARYTIGTGNTLTGGPNNPLYVEATREDMEELCVAAQLDAESRELILGGHPQSSVSVAPPVPAVAPKGDGLTPPARAIAAAYDLQKEGKPVSLRAACEQAKVDRANLRKRHPDAVRTIEALSSPDRTIRRGVRDRRTGDVDGWDSGDDD